MAPRILSWEEKIDEVLTEITKAKLELKIHIRRDEKLRLLISFKNDLVWQFYQKIRSISRKHFLDEEDEVTPEMEMYNSEIKNINNEIAQISEQIQAMLVKESVLRENLANFKEKLSDLVKLNMEEINLGQPRNY